MLIVPAAKIVAPLGLVAKERECATEYLDPQQRWVAIRQDTSILITLVPIELFQKVIYILIYFENNKCQVVPDNVTKCN